MKELFTFDCIIVALQFCSLENQNVLDPNRSLVSQVSLSLLEVRLLLLHPAQVVHGVDVASLQWKMST